MGKSRAEIQKNYRERKKQAEGKAYLKKESTRVLKYYVPSAELTAPKRKARNEKAKANNRKYRRDKKAKLQIQNDSASGYESMQENSLIVKMPFDPKGRGSGGKKKYTRALARAHVSLKSLAEEKEKYRKKYKAKLRQYERLKQKVSSTQISETGPSPIHASPLRSTESKLERLHLTPKSGKKVRRKLLEKNALLNEIKNARKSTKSYKDSSLISHIVSGRIVKKYRCVHAISKGIGISRRSLIKSSEKNKAVRPDRRVPVVKRLEASV
jgi:hypothetical protein